MTKALSVDKQEGKKWSDDEKKQLVDDLQKKMSHEDIAKAHGWNVPEIKSCLVCMVRKDFLDQIDDTDDDWGVIDLDNIDHVSANTGLTRSEVIRALELSGFE
jgi:hypothetical protein